MPQYSVVATNPSNDALPVGTWSAPASSAIRCDRVITPAGCVNTWWIPWFNVSLAQSPASWYALRYMQVYHPDKWGASGYVVRRLSDTSLQQASHSFVCEDGTFVADSRVVVDTCFDYPNASNYENGLLTGASAPQLDCAEVRPTNATESGLWQVLLRGSVDGTERCLRAHVPQADVQSYQQQLNAFIVSQRILDNDGYLIGVTA